MGVPPGMKEVPAHLASLNLDRLRRWTFIVNLPAPTDGRAIKNGRSSGAFGIPESMLPNGGETFIAIYGSM